MQNWWRYHHSQCWSKLKCHLSILVKTSLVPRMMPLKSIVLIAVYRKAFFHPYFCDRYKSLVYLVTLKLWYSYSYWLHILLLFAWMLFFDTCPCLDCLLFSVRFSLHNFYLEHNFDFFCGWSNFGYFALFRFAFTTFLWNLSWLEKF